MPKPSVITPHVDRAAAVLAPFSPDGSDNSTTIFFTAPDTAKVDVMPEEWEGCFITVLAQGANVLWFFTPVSTLEVDGTITATDAGTVDPQLGWPLPNGQAMDCEVPRAEPGQRIYFSRISDNANGTMTFRKSSTP